MCSHFSIYLLNNGLSYGGKRNVKVVYNAKQIHHNPCIYFLSSIPDLHIEEPTTHETNRLKNLCSTLSSNHTSALTYERKKGRLNFYRMKAFNKCADAKMHPTTISCLTFRENLLLQINEQMANESIIHFPLVNK